MDANLISYLSFLISFQLLFVGLFLFSNKRGNKRNNILLGLLFTLIAWNMVDLTLQMNGVHLGWKFLHHLDDSFFFLYGPLIYLFAQGVIYKDFELTKKHLWHLIPYSLLTLLLVMYSKLTPPSSSEEIINNPLPWQFYLISIVMYGHFYVYLFFAHRSLSNYRKILKAKYSEIQKMNLEWLSFTINSFGVLAFVSLVQNFVALTRNRTIFMITLILLLAFVFYFVNKVIIKALRQPEIFAGIAKVETEKYSGSNISSDQIENDKQKLLQYVNEEKPFLNPQISLSDLASKLSLSSKHLSQVINQSFGKSFFDFINGLRIKEVKRIFKATTDKKLTVMEAMYDAGFSSKSSFNTAFKKETGQTPTEYRKSIKKN